VYCHVVDHACIKNLSVLNTYNYSKAKSSFQLFLHCVSHYSFHLSCCGDILGPLLIKLASLGLSDVDLTDKMKKMAGQIKNYESLVKQLKVFFVGDIRRNIYIQVLMRFNAVGPLI